VFERIWNANFNENYLCSNATRVMLKEFLISAFICNRVLSHLKYVKRGFRVSISTVMYDGSLFHLYTYDENIFRLYLT